jgi:hypothetical protein
MEKPMIVSTAASSFRLSFTGNVVGRSRSVTDITPMATMQSWTRAITPASP